MNIYKPTNIQNNINVYKPVTVNKNVNIYKPISIEKSINVYKPITINKNVEINKSIDITKNIDNSKYIDNSKNINIQKSIVINKGGGEAEALAIAAAFAQASASASAQVNVFNSANAMSGRRFLREQRQLCRSASFLCGRRSRQHLGAGAAAMCLARRHGGKSRPRALRVGGRTGVSRRAYDRRDLDQWRL